jgi:hypothetical protein
VEEADLSAGLVDQLLEMCERRRDRFRGHPVASEVTSLNLRTDGPGFLPPGPLATYVHRTRTLLEGIDGVGTEPEADLPRGADLVHFDHHAGKVLVDGDRPGWVSANRGLGRAPVPETSDWTWPCCPSIFHAERPRRASSSWSSATSWTTTDPARVRALWAHVGLRMVDWSLRHPAVVDRWLAVAPGHL